MAAFSEKLESIDCNQITAIAAIALLGALSPVAEASTQAIIAIASLTIPGGVRRRHQASPTPIRPLKARPERHGPDFSD